jgi:hypothetical protein
MSGHRHVPTALPRTKDSSAPTEWDSEWVPVLVWSFWKTETPGAPAGNRKHLNKVIITKYAGRFSPTCSGYRGGSTQGEHDVSYGSC